MRGILLNLTPKAYRSPIRVYNLPIEIGNWVENKRKINENTEYTYYTYTIRGDVHNCGYNLFIHFYVYDTNENGNYVLTHGLPVSSGHKTMYNPLNGNITIEVSEKVAGRVMVLGVVEGGNQ